MSDQPKRCAQPVVYFARATVAGDQRQPSFHGRGCDERVVDPPAGDAQSGDTDGETTTSPRWKYVARLGEAQVEVFGRQRRVDPEGWREARQYRVCLELGVGYEVT